jgi:hypothetical protein
MKKSPEHRDADSEFHQDYLEEFFLDRTNVVVSQISRRPNLRVTSRSVPGGRQMNCKRSLESNQSVEVTDSLALHRVHMTSRDL